MSIVSSELVWRKPTETSDSGTNGGRMTATAIVSGVKNNLFPDVPQTERTAGSTKYRKAFIHVANDDDLALIAPKIFVTAPTPGDDYVVIFPGTQTSTQASIGTPPQLYGAGKLNAGVSAAGTTIAVLVEDWATAPIFASGMTIRISNKLTVDDVSGVEEYALLASAPAPAGNVITLTLTTGLINAYSAANTHVSSVFSPSDIVASATVPVVSGGGSYNSGTYPITPDALGSVQQNWTCTFGVGGSTFTIAGDTIGSLGTFNVTNDAAPNNPNYSKPYFTINRLGWTGAVQGTTMTFTTNPASTAIWYKRVVPPGAASLSGDKVVVGVDGESS
jgi:hypothetical protein